MTSCLRKKCRGLYAVEFPLVFIVFLFVVFFAAEISRFYLTKVALDSSLHSLVKEAKTNNSNSVSSLIPKHFNADSLYSVDEIEIAVNSCSGVENYLIGNCSSGLGEPQDIVRYQLTYFFSPLLPVVPKVMVSEWKHRSVLVVRNEPDFDSGNW
ncbi:hypothetical protein TUMSATVNIG1_13020 [Vibrio nigripulchritudo]|uniref:hypothetical protein n=1 Tax=Vibrio nigripulchritudo TaxID=28173 RepID=UPI001909E6C6|nr:hypothetical protein [Vibrio nigripulchritudo]BCL69357.1 hypothetical protein VNTUMSATTG_12940 [Vibrio nigripulchritudo]BDU30693.1 hypothetical protein TUMSATVNIG1_13020 [Vibrio nigripulchritudo]